jgi:hypothetical protein
MLFEAPKSQNEKALLQENQIKGPIKSSGGFIKAQNNQSQGKII